jgi:hypothetical protein
MRYEAPMDLRNKTVTIRFNRAQRKPIIVYYKNQRAGEAKPLDLNANAMLRRNK